MHYKNSKKILTTSIPEVFKEKDGKLFPDGYVNKEKNFFEGADFKKQEFKALIPKYYPAKYRKYIKEETDLLKK